MYKRQVIPATYHHEEYLKDHFDVIHGREANAMYYHEDAGEKRVVIYRVNGYIDQVLKKYFPSAEWHHSTACYLRSARISGNEMRCIIYNHHFKVIVFKEGKLQLVQYFSYNAPLDIVYYLGHIAGKMDMQIDATNLVISGLIGEKSILHREITRFFPNIILKESESAYGVSEEILDQPAHFFSHLTSLVQCV